MFPFQNDLTMYLNLPTHQLGYNDVDRLYNWPILF